MDSEELMRCRREIVADGETRLLPALLADAIVSVQELESQLLDAKRNEERAVERANAQAGMRMTELMTAGQEMEILKSKLHTLEAAVRAVRDGRRRGETGHWLARLLELVPDGSEGGGA